MFPSGSSHSSLYDGLGISDASFGSQNFPAPLITGGDANSPEALKQNIHLVHQQAARIQGLARSALLEIEHAYHPGRTPTAAYMTALKEALQSLVGLLRHSGVGALPLLNPTDPVPTEETLVVDTTKSIEVQYAKYKRLQESSSVVYNLLSSAEQSLRR